MHKWLANKVLGGEAVVYIYGLYDPLTGELFYVGKTRGEASKRLNGHCSEARLGNGCTTSHRIREILSRGQRPRVDVLKISNISQWQNDERELIEKFQRQGIQLTNDSPGGGGPF